MFFKGEYDLGCTVLVMQSVDTGDCKPIRQPLRRHLPPHAQAIRDQTAEMLRQDLIEPAVIEWTSNVVLVKKDGSLRFCIDYRHLNEVSHKDVYPLPRIDTCLDAMARARWFSTFDLRAGYHQVEMDPVNAETTTFITREGRSNLTL